MKTYLAKPGEVEGKHVIYDAQDMPLGRLAVIIANRLRGKDKPTYTPHVDTGDYVIVINASLAKLTGNKETKKIYQDFSGYRGGQKDYTAAEIREKNPERLVQDAVWGMMPHGRLGRAQFRKLKVYAGEEHPHAAQNPEKITF
jgi:large subunit ribosomal protein L13